MVNAEKARMIGRTIKGINERIRNTPTPLLTCPFCGGEAELEAVSTKNIANKRYKDRKAAEDALEALKPKYPDAVYAGIWEREGWGRAHNIKYYTYLDVPTYVCRCKNTKCIGRIHRQFTSEQEAVDAWNRREGTLRS